LNGLTIKQLKEIEEFIEFDKKETREAIYRRNDLESKRENFISKKYDRINFLSLDKTLNSLIKKSEFSFNNLLAIYNTNNSKPISKRKLSALLKIHYKIKIDSTYFNLYHLKEIFIKEKYTFLNIFYNILKEGYSIIFTDETNFSTFRK